MFPEAKSVGAWLRGGWHVTVAYVIGFAALMLTLGWQPHVPATPTEGAPAPGGHGAVIEPAPAAVITSDRPQAGLEAKAS
jgi:hypothetical protein